MITNNGAHGRGVEQTSRNPASDDRDRLLHRNGLAAAPHARATGPLGGTRLVAEAPLRTRLRTRGQGLAGDQQNKNKGGDPLHDRLCKAR